MSRMRIAIGSTLAGALVGVLAGMVGVDPVTAGLVGFGTAGVLFISLARRTNSNQ